MLAIPSKDPFMCICCGVATVCVCVCECERHMCGMQRTEAKVIVNHDKSQLLWLQGTHTYICLHIDICIDDLECGMFASAIVSLPQKLF